MKSFKSYTKLNEADTQASTDAEDLFVNLWNHFTGPGKGQSKDDFLNTPWDEYGKNSPLYKAYEYFLNYGGLDVPKSNRTKLRLPADQTEVSDRFYDLGMELLKQGKGWGSSPNAAPAGKSSPKVSKFWNRMTGKAKDTSKADIIINGQGVSVKNGGGARLMSGVESEAKATIMTAAKLSNADKKVEEELNNLLEGFTEPLIVQQAGIPGLEDTAPTLGAFKKIIADPKLRKQLNDKNKRAMPEYNRGDQLRTGAQEILKKHFNSDSSEFARAWAWEAASGPEKFSGKVMDEGAGDSSGEALWMFAFAPDLTKILIESIDSPSSPSVAKIARQTKIRFDFKSNRRKGGRGAYQTMQAGIETDFKKLERINESAFDELDKWDNMLTEEIITEVQFLRKVADIAKKAFKKLSSAWNSIKSKLLALYKAAAEAIKKGAQAIMDFFGIEMTNIQVNTEFKLL